MNKEFFDFEYFKGEYSELKEDIRLGTPVAVFGVSDQHKYLLTSMIKKRILYIAPDSVSANKAYESITILSGKKCVLFNSKYEVLLYKDALSKDSLYKRLCAIGEILNGAQIVVCDIEGAMQLLSTDFDILKLEINSEMDFSQLPKKLIAMGYTREYTVESKGMFAVRGDILDIYPINTDNPVRVDFFCDTIEKIKPYDINTGERLEEVKKLQIFSANDVKICQEDIPRIKQAINNGLKNCNDSNAYQRAKCIADDIFSKLENTTPFAGSSFVQPLLQRAGTIFDIMRENTLLVFDECKLINDKINGLYKEHSERVKELKKGGECFDFSLYQLLSPEMLQECFSKFSAIALQTFVSSMQFFNPLKTYKFYSTPSPSYINCLNQLVSDIKSWLANNYRILIFTGSVQRSERLNEILSDEYIPIYNLPDNLTALRGVNITSDELPLGLIIHDVKLVIIGCSQLYMKGATKRIVKKRGDMFSAPEIGDYVVHERHGIGKILGTEKIETTDGIKEYIAIQYSGNDKLYVPVEQMDILSKYVGESNPTLSRIGGEEFERVKERVRRSIKALAFDLKKLYAERSEKKGYYFPENTAMMDEFECSFEYEETPDQLTSIEEIKNDMSSVKVMDRLLCGDVGYGKTEIALRAIYLCVLGGKQAALMCPSTILSEQHFNTAIERLGSFGVRIEKLNRFKTQKEQERTLKRLANGDIDLIVGTHRLLSNDVKFYDLGLLVLDEEQRFGVEHKEKIKNIKNNIDCLTMTATPIPRTLHMSLSGIRDISTINTPPQKRLPVQTYVVEETETLIRDACIREISRGGQVFILYNRVESISDFAGKITQLVPEGKVCYAHGRMDKTLLENNVFGFYKGEKNILVTTTIIENGIDLPNANTIIVIDSDRLGISQLYQLRGRVGRGSRLAQAYFTFKPDKVLTADATARLKAIMQFTELGSGFKIAMRDLEIRGAGNVLGAEQHGHMDRVGYELYSKLLKEEMTGQSITVAELEIKATAYIPDYYIESNAGRMDCYKQIAEIRSVEDYKRVCVSIEDNYGRMPEEVLNLLIIAVLKSYASKYNIRKINVDRKGGYFEFSSVDKLQAEGLSQALEKYKRDATLSMAKTVQLNFKGEQTQTATMLKMTKFLKFALSFSNSV